MQPIHVKAWGLAHLADDERSWIEQQNLWAYAHVSLLGGDIVAVHANSGNKEFCELVGNDDRTTPLVKQQVFLYGPVVIGDGSWTQGTEVAIAQLSELFDPRDCPHILSMLYGAVRHAVTTKMYASLNSPISNVKG